jgi:hypothetical protein
MRRALPFLVVLFATACTTTPPRPTLEQRFETFSSVEDEGVAVRFDEREVTPAIAKQLAKTLVAVRAAVARELALDLKADAPPAAEVILYRDAGWGLERWLVTHAQILERPLRVRVPCALPDDDDTAEKIAHRVVGTVAHELAESAILTRVPILDPYLRWMHDGIADSVEYRVLLQLDPAAAAADLARFAQYSVESRLKGTRWVDLTRWRQLPDWIVHSEVVFENKAPLRLGLDDVPTSLRRLARERKVPQSEGAAEGVLLLDELRAILGETWTKESIVGPREEEDPHPRAGQFLCYDASFCFWLDLERTHPGITAKIVAIMSAHRAPILRSADVVHALEQATGVSLAGKLERFSLDRIDAILAAERARQER